LPWWIEGFAGQLGGWLAGRVGDQQVDVAAGVLEEREIGGETAAA
jgi:hypothetical protein